MNEFTKIPYGYDLEVALLNEKFKVNGHVLTRDEKDRIRLMLKAMFPEKFMKKGEDQ